MGFVILDTDVASRLYKSTLPNEFEKALEDNELFISFVTLAEMHKGARRARWGSKRLADLESWLAGWPVIHSDDSVALAWAELVSASEDEGRPIAPNDAWIAACAISADFMLATFNRRHFEHIGGLNLLSEY